MTFTISSVVGAMVSLLSASTVMGPNAVSASSYQHLESSPSAAAFIRYATVGVAAQSMGETLRAAGAADITLGMEFYVRDTGNAAATIARVTTLSDAVLTAVLDSDNLGSTVDEIREFRLNNQETNPQIYGGQTWLRFDGTITGRILNL